MTELRVALDLPSAKSYSMTYGLFVVKDYENPDVDYTPWFSVQDKPIVSRANVTYPTDVPTYPVEKGYPISDNARPGIEELTIDGYLYDKRREKLEKILELRNKKKLLTIVCEDFVMGPCVLRDFSVTATSDSLSSYTFTATFRRIRVAQIKPVETKFVETPTGAVLAVGPGQEVTAMEPCYSSAELLERQTANVGEQVIGALRTIADVATLPITFIEDTLGEVFVRVQNSGFDGGATYPIEMPEAFMKGFNPGFVWRDVQPYLFYFSRYNGGIKVEIYDVSLSDVWVKRPPSIFPSGIPVSSFPPDDPVRKYFEERGVAEVVRWPHYQKDKDKPPVGLPIYGQVLKCFEWYRVDEPITGEPLFAILCLERSDFDRALNFASVAAPFVRPAKLFGQALKAERAIKASAVTRALENRIPKIADEKLAKAAADVLAKGDKRAKVAMLAQLQKEQGLRAPDSVREALRLKGEAKVALGTTKNLGITFGAMATNAALSISDLTTGLYTGQQPLKIIVSKNFLDIQKRKENLIYRPTGALKPCT